MRTSTGPRCSGDSCSVALWTLLLSIHCTWPATAPDQLRSETGSEIERSTAPADAAARRDIMSGSAPAAAAAMLLPVVAASVAGAGADGTASAVGSWFDSVF